MGLKKITLKIYEAKGFHEVEVSKKVCPFKAIKENDERIRDYADKNFPDWKRIIVIFEYDRIKQRWLIEKS